MGSPQPPQPPQSRLDRVPGEISLLIYSHLPNRDIKNLRLVSSFFDRTARLRLDRVFISANPLNIEVFEAISQHDEYRTRVTEIIWDDALLASYRYDDQTSIYGGHPKLPPEGESCPEWYARACRNNKIIRRQWLSANDFEPDTPERERQFASQLSLEDSWAYYQSLVRQQHEVLKSSAHLYALKSGIGRFPALRKITVTDSAHGRLFTPLYETPMIRAFPRGFNYAIPKCTWREPFINYSEIGDDGWDSFRVLMKFLAQNLDSGKVTELYIRPFLRDGGLARTFEDACTIYTNLEMVVGRPNFESLDLDPVSIAAFDGAYMIRQAPWDRVLVSAAKGQGLKKLALERNFFSFATPSSFQGCFQRLEHFSLSKFSFKEDKHLVALLAMLPSIRTVKLRFLEFRKGSHSSPLYQIKDTLGWQDRISRPRLSIILTLSESRTPGHATWVEKEVDKFLYEGGINPFGEGPDPRPEYFYIGTVKDDFDPGFQRPRPDPQGLLEIGYRGNDTSDPKFNQAYYRQQFWVSTGCLDTLPKAVQTRLAELYHPSSL